MGYLSDALMDRCRDVLLSCDQFENRKILCAVFSTDELCEFKYRIPFADDQVELVDRFLEYILEKRVKTGKPAFSVFLATLRDRYKGESRWDKLTELLEEAEIRALEQPAQTISTLSPRQKQDLYQKLLTLDFEPQVDQFWDVIDQHRIAAFLVHGPPQHGQQLLTRRLVRFREKWGTGQLVMIDATSNGVGKSSDALWSQVAAQLDVKDKKDRQVLADKVCEWWKTQDVIFLLPTVDYLPQEVLSTWLDEFWKPIAAAARQRLPLTPSNTHLLLFLVDFSGHVCETKVTLLDQPGQILNSHAPLKLPPTGKIEEKELKQWIRAAAELFPKKLDAMTLIGSTENGTPDLVYKKIFETCGLDWEGVKLP